MIEAGATTEPAAEDDVHMQAVPEDGAHGAEALKQAVQNGVRDGVANVAGVLMLTADGYMIGEPARPGRHNIVKAGNKTATVHNFEEVAGKQGYGSLPELRQQQARQVRWRRRGLRASGGVPARQLGGQVLDARVAGQAQNEL